MSGGGIGLVKASKSSAFKEGDVVSGFVPWSSYFVADAASLVSSRAHRLPSTYTLSICHGC
jgi:NADPH-dependent curcumin reductase CurA